MMNLRGSTLAYAATGLAIAIVAPVPSLWAGGPVAANQQVPFKESLAGTVTVTPLDPPRLLLMTRSAREA